MTDLDDLVASTLNGLSLPEQPTADPPVSLAGEVNDPLPDEPKTELGYARRFIAVYGPQVRYVTTWRRWLIWDGQRWAHDTTGQTNRWAKVIARRLTLDAQAIADNDLRRAAVKDAKRGESSAGVSAALTLASTEPEVAVCHDQLDADPLLLNVANGTVDLRSGQLRPHQPADLLTKVTGANYHPNQPPSEPGAFSKFLADIQPDPAMRAYLARLLGLALEGRQNVHILPIWWGDGANGKSTLIDAVMAALGDYAAPAAAGLLTARRNDSHPTETADLHGRRLAILHETDAGRRLAEGTVKRLTGGDTIKARRMREDFWEFAPSHTFVMLTNHKPVVSGNDEGIWRRLKLVPFQVIIPPGRRDEHLATRLANDTDAILSWLIAGHQQWQHHGLNDPDQVTEATSAYRAESDPIGRFLDDACLQAPGYRTRSSDLYTAWRTWATTEGEEPGTQKAFTQALTERGYEITKTRVGMVIQGIGIAENNTHHGQV